MGYEKIDDILSLWAKKRNLLIYRTYKEQDVRSLELVSAKGQRFQIWVDLPDENGQIGVHVWDYKKRKKDFVSSQVELAESMEDAYNTAMYWDN